MLFFAAEKEAVALPVMVRRYQREGERWLYILRFAFTRKEKRKKKKKKRNEKCLLLSRDRFFQVTKFLKVLRLSTQALHFNATQIRNFNGHSFLLLAEST